LPNLKLICGKSSIIKTYPRARLPFDDLRPSYKLHLTAVASRCDSRIHWGFPKYGEIESIYTYIYNVFDSSDTNQERFLNYSYRNVVWVHRFHSIQELKLNSLIGRGVLERKIWIPKNKQTENLATFQHSTTN
jgi:hypothetical protein